MSAGGKSGLTGQSVQRVEDDRLLRGHGQYVADVTPPGCLHATFLRSPMPHARIVSIDIVAATELDGVVAVYTGADMKRITNPFLPIVQLPGLYTPLHWPLAEDKVRLVGDPVALVVAESRAVAEDAAELIDVEYESLTAIGTIDQALDPSSEPVWDRAGGNVMYEATQTHGDVDGVFARADRVVTRTFECPRQSNQPMETRGIVVELDDETGEVIVHAATQAGHLLRWNLAALTQPVGGVSGLTRFLRNSARRSSFGAAAKAFFSEHQDTLKSQDNAGMQSQLKKEPATMRHMARAAMTTASKTNLPRVVARDIGGGFGAKGAVTKEDVAVTAAALDLGYSIKWVEDRAENLADGGQAREERMTLSMAVDDDGTIRGLRTDIVLDQGAYPGTPVSGATVTQLMRVMWPGSYRIEAYEQHSRVVSTNKGRYIAYRGPWANETWTRERMVDVVAAELGMSPADVRLRNMFGPDDYPAAMVTGPTLDITMSTKGTLEEALRHIDRDEFERARAEAAERGHRLGLGIASYHEAAPGPPNYWDSVAPGNDMLMVETARAEVTDDGKVQVRTPQMPHGQSHETTYAQLAADQLGVPMSDVTIIYGDTSATPFSFLGTGGSRGGPVGGGAVRKTTRSLREKVLERAADLLEASVDDLDIVDGNIHVAGVPARGISFTDVAAAAEPEELHVEETYKSAGDGGWSCATHVAWVDIDLATGRVDIPRYLVVEDCGPIINPAIVDGQVRGGVAQGIGAVFYERVAYDDDAGLRSSTYMDYLVPTAMEIPDIEVMHLETLSPGENDYRGVGEGGMIAAPAALTNAVSDALGVQITEQYLPPSRILELAGVIEPD